MTYYYIMAVINWQFAILATVFNHSFLSPPQLETLFSKFKGFVDYKIGFKGEKFNSNCSKYTS